MEKIKVNLLINDYKINDIGILNNDIIQIKDNDTLIEYNQKDNILIRENEEMKQVINYNKGYFTYLLKELNNEIKEKINLISLTNKPKQVNIIYQIGEDTFNLTLKYETIY